MILLEFTQERFKHYDFAKRVYSMLHMFYDSVIVESHLHIALIESQYLIYDNATREVFDIGEIDRENWLGTLPKVFESAENRCMYGLMIQYLLLMIRTSRFVSQERLLKS